MWTPSKDHGFVRQQSLTGSAISTIADENWMRLRYFFLLRKWLLSVYDTYRLLHIELIRWPWPICCLLNVRFLLDQKVFLYPQDWLPILLLLRPYKRISMVEVIRKYLSDEALTFCSLQILEGSSTFAGYIAAKLLEAVDRRPLLTN